MDALTRIEESELSRLESIIEKGQQTFVEVGAALMEIRDSGLYKMFGTFENYCKERWGYNSSRARQLIASAKVTENLKSVTTVTPTTERQTRPLSSLEPAQQQEAWQKAVETAPEGKVTAKHVQDVVDEMEGKNEEKEFVEPEPVSVSKDSKNLSQLKFYWEKSSSADHKRFRVWLRSQKD